MSRKLDEIRYFWQRRVEGQVRDVMHKHPDYFAPDLTRSQRASVVGSIGKRVVGEIVAVVGCEMAAAAGRAGALADRPEGMPDASKTVRRGVSPGNDMGDTPPLHASVARALGIEDDYGREVLEALGRSDLVVRRIRRPKWRRR